MNLLEVLCVCIFVVKYANCLQFENESPNENINNEDIIRKMLSYFQQSSWSEKSSKSYGSTFQSPVTIIKSPTIERTYRTEISVKQSSHPYLFQIMQMIPIKVQIPFQFIYEKLFKYFIALQQFNFQTPTPDTIIQILKFVFPELGEHVYEIARYPIGPPMLKFLFEMILPQLSKQDLELIFGGAHTTEEFIINLVLYLCPNIKSHFLWKDNLPTNGKLSIILDILFPGGAPTQLINESMQKGDFQNSMYIFLDLLFQGKLIPTSIQNPKFNGPEWLSFQTILTQNNINYQIIPQDVLYYLFSNYKTPQFKVHLLKLKEKLQESNQPYKIDSHTLTIWTQYLNDLRAHKKTLNDMPQEIKVLLEQYKNPQELIKIMSDSIGFSVDASKLHMPLNPEIMELWKKFIFDILNHKGDTTHLPKELLDYFNSLSKNPDYKSHLNSIFDALSINPNIASHWNIFFDQLRDGRTTLDQMPTDLVTFLTNHKNPEEFLRVILKLKNSHINTSFLNIDTNPEMMQLWKKYIEDVAKNKGHIRNIPQPLLQYFYTISSNPANVEYIKLLFSPDKINPKTLNTWNLFINDLRSHKADLKDMPPEIIQLMLKYKSPDEFFKVLLPQSNIEVNMNLTPDDTVKKQWIDWILSLQHQNTSVLDTPTELKDFFHKISPSADFQTTLQDIYSINPDLQTKWKQFVRELKQHKTSMFKMPNDLKKYIIKMKSPKEFVNLIFKTLEPPLMNPIPTPSEDILPYWEDFLSGFKKDHGGVRDAVVISTKLSKYFLDASDDLNYKHTLNNIYQMDADMKTMFEDLKEKMLHDYSARLDNMPAKLNKFFYKFDRLEDFLRSVLGGLQENFDIKRLPDEKLFAEFWDESILRVVLGHETEIHPETKFALKYLTKDTIIGNQIDGVIKVHEHNALIRYVEKFWGLAKRDTRVHDGLEVFIGFMDRLGNYYGKSEELCEERSRIVDALDRLRNSFAAKSECTVNKYLTKYNL